MAIYSICVHWATTREREKPYWLSLEGQDGKEKSSKLSESVQDGPD